MKRLRFAVGAVSALAIVGLSTTAALREGEEDDQGRQGVVVTPTDHSPCWDPDGRAIYFVSDRLTDGEDGEAVFRVDAQTLRIDQLTPPGFIAPAASPSGKYLLVADTRRLRADRQLRWAIVDVASGQYTTLDTDTRHSYRDLRFGASDRELLFVHRADTRVSADIYAVDVNPETGAMSSYRPVFRHPAPLELPVWSGDGQRLAFAINPHRVDDATERYAVGVVSAAEPRTSEMVLLQMASGEHVRQLSWFADARRLMIATDASVKIADIDASEVDDYRQFLQDSGHLSLGVLASMGDPVPCPDGSDRVVVRVRVDTGDDRIGYYLGVMALDGSGFRQVTFDRGK